MGDTSAFQFPDVGKIQSPKTAAPGMSESPFEKLPAKIRNQIWKYAVVYDEPLDIKIEQRIERECKFRLSNKTATSLPSTCKQIRQECIGVFYRNNTFRLKFDRPNSALITFGQAGSSMATHVYRFLHANATRNIHGIARVSVMAWPNRAKRYGNPVLDIFNLTGEVDRIQLSLPTSTKSLIVSVALALGRRRFLLTVNARTFVPDVIYKNMHKLDEISFSDMRPILEAAGFSVKEIKRQ